MILGHRAHDRLFQQEWGGPDQPGVSQLDVDVTGIACDEERRMDPARRLDSWTTGPHVQERQGHRREEGCGDDVQLDDAEHAADRDRDESSADDGDPLAGQAASSHVLIDSAVIDSAVIDSAVIDSAVIDSAVIDSARYRHGNSIEDLADRVGGRQLRTVFGTHHDSVAEGGMSDCFDIVGCRVVAAPGCSMGARSCSELQRGTR